ncbi:hypothetical protein AB0399_38935 [Streptomyces sp. NPDC088194]|uniref:hypothetical protein n=1 Tax=Streptomyces sp. NPDC088194 TaxID=3154931 RepID=UPI00344CEDEA
MNVEPGATTRRAAAPAAVAEGADRARVPGSVPAVAGAVVFSPAFPATGWALEGVGPWTVTTVRAVVAVPAAVSAGVAAVVALVCGAVTQRAGR